MPARIARSSCSVPGRRADDLPCTRPVDGRVPRAPGPGDRAGRRAGRRRALRARADPRRGAHRLAEIRRRPGAGHLRSPMQLRRSTLILGIALVMGVLAAVAIHQTLERKVQDIEARGKTKTLRVLVPKEDLPKGTPLTTRVVAVREMPAEWVHSNAVTP